MPFSWSEMIQKKTSCYTAKDHGFIVNQEVFVVGKYSLINDFHHFLVPGNIFILLPSTIHTISANSNLLRFFQAKWVFSWRFFPQFPDRIIISQPATSPVRNRTSYFNLAIAYVPQFFFDTLRSNFSSFKAENKPLHKMMLRCWEHQWDSWIRSSPK